MTVAEQKHFRNILGCSLAAHILVLLLLTWQGFLQSQSKMINLDAEIVWTTELKSTKVSKVDKPASSDSLPRQLSKPLVKQKKKVSMPAPKTEKAPLPKKKVDPGDALGRDEKRRQLMAAALAGLNKNAESKDKASDEVSVGGPELELFKSRVKQRVESNMFMLDSSWVSRYRDRLVSYRVTFDVQGRIKDIVLVQSSGVDSMDKNVREAIKQCNYFDLPEDEEIRRLILRSGIQLDYKPGDG